MADLNGIGRPARPCVPGIVLCLALGLPLAASAAQGIERMDAFLKDIKSFRADFSQTVLDPKGKAMQQGQGVLTLVKPGKFRWEYQKPYQQLIVSDGSKLWIYDPDLEQVTVKPVDKGLGSTPALLLSGVHPIEQDFTVKDAGEHDGLAWVELLPKAQDTSFTRILLGFSGEQLQRMELDDSFGQVTRLRFQHAQRNPDIAPAQFRFKPPAGVDVVGDDD